jgi:hypothetical protein
LIDELKKSKGIEPDVTCKNRRPTCVNRVEKSIEGRYTPLLEQSEAGAGINALSEKTKVTVVSLPVVIQPKHCDFRRKIRPTKGKVSKETTTSSSLVEFICNRTSICLTDLP